MSLISNYEYIRDWCNNRFLKKSDQVQVDLSNYYTKNEVDTVVQDVADEVQVGYLYTNNTSSQSTGNESFKNTIYLHKISKTGSYNDLLNKPTIPSAPGTLNTNNTTTQTASASESLSGTINLHKISKTGKYIDLLNKPNVYTFVCSTAAGTAAKVATTTVWGSDFAVPAGTVVAIYFNNTNTASVSSLKLRVGNTVGSIKRSVNGSLVNLRSTDSLKTKETYWFNYDGTYWVLMNDDTTPGTLTTTSTTALSAATNESLSGSISLHKVSKTGNYNDLLNTPTIPTTTSSVTSGSTAALTSGGAYTALSAKEDTSNKVTSISSSSTDTQYPSAKAVYTQIGNIEAILDQIIQPTS